MKSRWKLRLYPEHLVSSINDLPPLPPGKSVVDILTDFIRYLFRCAKSFFEAHHSHSLWLSVEDSIEYIFAHPSCWEGVQQQLYRQAIERAGFVPSTPKGRSRVHMLPEDEASLHFCTANLLDVDTTNRPGPQGVVIIDAGSGTIDLSMFSMSTNPILCEEIAPAECMKPFPTVESFSSLIGRLQGSVFVTHRGKSLLESW